MDPIGIAIGAGVFLFGWVMGRMDRRSRRPKLLDPNVCGCGHHESYHDAKGCGHVGFNYVTNANHGCTCKRFASVDPSRYLSYKELGG